MLDWIHEILALPIDRETARTVLGSLGLVNSLLTFAIATIVVRPAMVRWRPTSWRILALSWVAVGLCLIEILSPDKTGPLLAGSFKVGVLIWAFAMARLLILVRQILYVHRSALRVLGRTTDIDEFPEFDPGELGPAFLNRWNDTLHSLNKRFRFPVLISADREAHGLDVAQGFVAAGLRRDAGAIYLSFTRPASIIMRQILKQTDVDRSDLSKVAGRFVIIDCYSELYCQEDAKRLAERGLSGFDLPAGSKLPQVRRCDPRDPIAVQKVYKKELHAMQTRGVKQVRVVYDSLSDFLGLADPELVVSYLRHMVVFDERLNVLTMYLLWPGVLQAPMSDSYLSWFFTSVIRLRNEDGQVTAELENVSEIAGRKRIDAGLDLADRGFGINRDRAHAIALAVRGLGYKAIPMADSDLFPTRVDPRAVADFFFFLTAIDHQTALHGERYEETIGDRTYRGSDLMYMKAMHCTESNPDLFSATQLADVAESDVASWFQLSSGISIANPGLRAYLLRDAAQVLLSEYGGSVLELISRSDGRLESPRGDGFLKLLDSFRAYEDPLRKKSHLLAKLLVRRGLLTVTDPENEDVAVDPVLVSVALRSGLVTVSEETIADDILASRILSQDVTTRLRSLTLRAFRLVSEVSGLPPYELDDLLWGFGRILRAADKGALGSSLEHNRYTKGVRHREQLEPFLAELKGTLEPGNPLAGRELTPSFPETWYF